MALMVCIHGKPIPGFNLGINEYLKQVTMMGQERTSSVLRLCTDLHANAAGGTKNLLKEIFLWSREYCRAILFNVSF